MVIAIVVAWRWEWIYDWYRGISYQPSAEMATIRTKLKLTGQGEFIFNAAQPELNDAADFNENCRQDETEVAVLGCYTLGNIYVYDIKDARLDGIRELTAAHELLHAFWAKMDNGERERLQPILNQVYKNNLAILKDDIETYAESERLEEIFVRAGTEIKELPIELEEIYARVFENQDAVVDFYDNYSAVFREMKTRLENLADELESLKSQIDEKIHEYEVGVANLEKDIINFNSCAETVGCFQSNAEFYAQRNALIARESALNVLNDEVNVLIDNYNDKVNEYNSNALESRRLQNIINSKAETTEIK